MEVIKTIRPGRDGSKRYLEAYGEQLICVRYRRDKDQHRNLITVELIVDQIPQPRCATPPDPGDDHPIYLKIEPYERDLQIQVRQHGGKWDQTTKCWRLGYRAARRLRITHRIDSELSCGFNLPGAPPGTEKT